MSGNLTKSTETDEDIYLYWAIRDYLATVYAERREKANAIERARKEISAKKKNGNGKKILKEIGWFALKTVGISAAVLGGIAVAVPALGFGAVGVTAGSAAAAYQSAVLGGTIVSGSAFATLQSIGAAGLALSTKLGIIAGSATASTALTANKLLKKSKSKPENDKDYDRVKYKKGGEITFRIHVKNKRNVSTQT